MFVKELEKQNKEEIKNIEELENIIKNTADKILKRKNRKQLTNNKSEEPVLIYDKVWREIKERKRLKRNRRNAKNMEERWKRLYCKQK